MVDYTGTAGDDTFVGSTGDDSAQGLAGDDNLSGGDGNDTLNGGDGADTLDGGAGDDQLSSAQYNDESALAERDKLLGGDGSDTISAGYGDNVDGGSGHNVLFLDLQGAPSGLTIDFTQPTATIGGGTIINIQEIGSISATQHADHITVGSTTYGVYGQGGNDVITLLESGSVDGGTGNDVIDARGAGVGENALRIDGNIGADTIYAGSDADFVSGDTGRDLIYAGGNVDGGGGKDQIYVQDSSYKDIINGGTASDKIVAGSADALIYGGTGSDTLIGGSGNDTLDSFVMPYPYEVQKVDSGLAHDSLSGGGGNDTLFAGYGDSVDGGTGSDTLSLSFLGAVAGVRFAESDIMNGHSASLGGGVITNIETVSSITGSNFDDVLHIAEQTAPLSVDGGKGDDLIIVDAAAYTINGAVAHGTFDGGAGINTFDLRDEASGAQVDLGTARYGGSFDGSSLHHFQDVAGSAYADTLQGSDAANLLNGRAGDDVLNGLTGNDTLLGGSGSDTISGGAGNDTISGGSGGDHLDTGTGNNSISGGSGNDVVTIGDGVDTLSGGSGHDRFVFGDDLIGTTADKEDRITDFGSGDKIDLSQIDAHSWVFIGENAFTPDSIPQVRYYESGGNTYIEGDLGGYGIKDFIIRLDGLHDLTSTDFAFGNH